MRRCRLSRVLLVGLMSCLARVGGAQEGSAPSAGVTRNGCLDTIPDSVMHRVPVYLTPNPVDSSGSRMPLRDGIDLMTQAVAQIGRSLLGAAEGTLPNGEPSVGWRSLDGDVLVIARRNGTMEGRVKPPRYPSQIAVNDAGVRLVARALDSAFLAGERLFFPDSLRVDSVSWLFHLEPAVLSESGEMTPPKTRIGIPVFSVNAPPERQVAAERVRVSYPPRLRNLGFMGHVLMQFVVDTSGHVDQTTIRDLYPAGYAPLASNEREVYDEFIRSVRYALEGARYRPARIGGCVVRQLVQQPFSFVLGDGGLPTR